METTNQKKIIILVTGGTILCSYDEVNHEVIPNVPADRILNGIKKHGSGNRIVVSEFSNIPSPHLSIEMGEKLVEEARSILNNDDVRGLVVVQGTDVLEEIAYLFHLVLDTPKPVVFTGSMKNRDDLYSDYRGNIDGAIRIIESKESSGRGVMVYFNQEIHSAEYVEKENTNNVASFKSPQFGPIGVVYNDNVEFLGRVEPAKHYKPIKLDNNVQIIKATYSMNDLLLRACIRERVPGVIIEGLGAGNVPPNLIPAIKDALSSGMAVVLTSRCHTGHVIGTYGYEGGGAELVRLGVINGKNLGGVKARIKLIVLLGMQPCADYLSKEF